MKTKMRLKLISTCLIILTLILSLVGCGSNNSTNSNSNSKTLNVAYDVVPPSIDPHMTTSAAVMEITRPVFETLVALDAENNPKPQLAESWKFSEDGKTVTFELRKGVKFHNGKEMTSADVVASMERWEKLSPLAQGRLKNATFTAQGKYIVLLNLAKPDSTVLMTLANPLQYSAIMPKEIIDSATQTGVKKYIGTGPFKVVKADPQQYLNLEKFTAYKPIGDTSSGLSGRHEAKVEKININFVKDPSTRVSGLESGQYDLATGIPYDNYATLKNNSNLKSYMYDFGLLGIAFNKKQGVFADQKMRQAVQYALKKKDVLTSAFVNPKFFELEPMLATGNQPLWNNNQGEDVYNSEDVNKAKQLLAESGYKGQKITIITTRDYEYLYNASIAIQQQLKKIGMNVKLENYDWPTLLKRRAVPQGWDMFTMGWLNEAVPVNYNFLYSKNEYPGWTNDPKIDDLIVKIQSVSDMKEVSPLFSQLQKEFYMYAPIAKLGDFKNYAVHQKSVSGLSSFNGAINLWNVTKK
ncbi:ABC transporter substrate-binding protein [Sporolactobacillus sp. THM19-2]|uniref:ABC transporter substrate-binding protein n=1 Tax=Sporolactobacillus sp. THM19-2 TaxID=2511171 RepID=UPI00101EFB57|nr:ABC transporter substrate-binding protein [Sporolactobacillus sp. THM19-2]RYL86391.1 ABC transporter substrate-binding protein [Sporolactobacillus sp. THM19-2]